MVFGVKEMPSEFFSPETTYAFFSHTIKGQAYNMPMLKKMMSLGCNLIDYERVANESGQRLLFFGRYAGLAGMIDSLWALGKRLSWEGIANPFSQIRQTYQYNTLEEAKQAVAEAGKKIAHDGLDGALLPLVCGFAGYGHVSMGAQEIFDLLPFEKIAPEDIRRVFNDPSKTKHTLYKVVFEEKHLVEPVSPDTGFVLQDYYDHPEKFRSRFESYLPLMILFINAIYWTEAYPRLVTKAGLKRLFESESKPRLRVIGDITCDIEGAVECTLRITRPDNPIFVYDPFKENATDGHEGNGVVVMAVDNLPCELPHDASVDFGNNLLRFVPDIASADFSIDFESVRLPDPIKKSVILHRGDLTPPYQYMKQFLRSGDNE